MKKISPFFANCFAYLKFHILSQAILLKTKSLSRKCEHAHRHLTGFRSGPGWSASRSPCSKSAGPTSTTWAASSSATSQTRAYSSSSPRYTFTLRGRTWLTSPRQEREHTSVIFPSFFSLYFFSFFPLFPLLLLLPFLHPFPFLSLPFSILSA